MLAATTLRRTAVVVARTTISKPAQIWSKFTKQSSTQQHQQQQIRTFFGGGAMNHKVTRENIANLRVEILEPLEEHKSTIIWMHGLGDSSAGFRDLMDAIIPNTTRCVLPNAPQRPVTLNGGVVMPSWYDIYSLDRDVNGKEDEETILDSYERVKALVDHEAKLLNNRTDKIIIGGFSQGGAMASLVGLTYPHRLGGIVSCSSYVIHRKKLQELIKAANNANKDTPFLAYHGEEDSMVPIDFARECYQKYIIPSLLGQDGATGAGGHMPKHFEFISERYQDHEVTNDEIRVLHRWFKERLEA